MKHKEKKDSTVRGKHNKSVYSVFPFGPRSWRRLDVG